MQMMVCLYQEVNPNAVTRLGYGVQISCCKSIMNAFNRMMTISRMKNTCFIRSFENDLEGMMASGLVQVLEASAGRKCCQSLITWSKSGALNAHDSDKILYDET